MTMEMYQLEEEQFSLEYGYSGPVETVLSNGRSGYELTVNNILTSKTEVPVQVAITSVTQVAGGSNTELDQHKMWVLSFDWARVYIEVVATVNEQEVRFENTWTGEKSSPTWITDSRDLPQLLYRPYRKIDGVYRAAIRKAFDKVHARLPIQGQSMDATTVAPPPKTSQQKTIPTPTSYPAAPRGLGKEFEEMVVRFHRQAP